MAVLSIRKYLTDCGTESTNPYLRVCTLLLEGIAQAALAYDREQYSEYRANLRNLASALETTVDDAALVGVAQAATEEMERYNRGAEEVHAAQTVELRCMIEMLSKTLLGLAEAGGQSVQALQDIRNQVESARQLDDIRLLRSRLGDSLKSLSDEARRQRERNAEMLRHAEEALRIAINDREDSDIDRVSGLPSVYKAQSEIASRLGPDSRYYAAVFVVERVETINLQYGYAAGDQLLQAFGQYLASKLPRTDEVFRWRGPAFMVLLDRSSPIHAVRTEVARFASAGQEHAMLVDGRPVKLPLNCAWTVVELATCHAAGHVSQQIDSFVAEHGEKGG